MSCTPDNQFRNSLLEAVRFVAIAARICPNDVRLTLEQAIPGGMSLEDYSLMREVIAAIREGLPDADQMQPGQVFQHVLGALGDSQHNARSRRRYAHRPQSWTRGILATHPQQHRR
jgi:hypothetical protein